VGNQNLPTLSTENRFNQIHLESVANAALLQTYHSTQIPRVRPLTLGDRMNLLSLTEPNPTDSMVKVKVSEQRDAEKCG
jgi:hypothetical protein